MWIEHVSQWFFLDFAEKNKEKTTTTKTRKQPKKAEWFELKNPLAEINKSKKNYNQKNKCRLSETKMLDAQALSELNTVFAYEFKYTYYSDVFCCCTVC